MSENKTGGPAFPTEHTDTSGLFDGMTLRDYFAAKAIQVIEPPIEFYGSRETQESFNNWASKAWKMADAMLKARES